MSDSATMPAAALRRTDLPKLSLGTKTAATLLAIVAAVVLPQLFHIIGAVSGQGTMLGVAFLPMHLPVLPSAPSPEPPRRSPASCCPACRCWRCCRS